MTTDRLFHLNDDFLKSVKNSWFQDSHDEIDKHHYETLAQEWFLSSKLCHIVGADQFEYVDAILGCTHYLDSLYIKHGRDLQVLHREYVYHKFMGIMPSEIGNLKPNTPLIISLPNWYYCDVIPEWNQILDECLAKDIDIHIDMAWITACRDISIDVGHPAVKSFAMSLSKLSMEWNRVGLRWSRQRTMDSITVFNHYQGRANAAVLSCGAFIMDSVPRDYAWNTYGQQHMAICDKLELRPSKAIHVAHGKQGPVGIARLLLDFSAPVGI